MRNLIIALIGMALFSSCQNSIENFEIFGSEEMHKANRKLIEISIEDIYNPPVATRVFAYPNLLAYEVYSHKKGNSPISKITDIQLDQNYGDTLNIDYSIAALEAYCIIAKKMVFSEYLADSMSTYFLNKALASNIPAKRVENSREYGRKIAKAAKPWIDGDNYAQVKSDDFYSIRGHDSTWILTPPNYEPPLEPNWKKLRPIVLDDVKNFQPKARPVFSTEKDSEFYKQALLVYNQGKENVDETKSIAKHWDCNPNEFIQKGHNVTFNHRISPPGHWIGITKALCDATNANLEKTILAYAGITVAMFDGIIACWHTKYTEELIRPVSYINRYIDNTWKPYIQTPPFPEYTSGHSVVSGCSSSILEELFPKTAFVDITEVEFGLPARNFTSVYEAGEEASLSRYYGGIHYRFGVDNGLEQGRKIGLHILKELNK